MQDAGMPTQDRQRRWAAASGSVTRLQICRVVPRPCRSTSGSPSPISLTAMTGAGEGDVRWMDEYSSTRIVHATGDE